MENSMNAEKKMISEISRRVEIYGVKENEPYHDLLVDSVLNILKLNVKGKKWDAYMVNESDFELIVEYLDDILPAPN